jgi:putative SOS response-associated peptidase YedK
VPVVYETREGERIGELMRWGLVPSWAKDPSIGHKLNNARAEGVFEKPSFRQAIRKRRCLLPASGFYEWQVTGGAKAPKQPWYISAKDGEPFAFAGLFEAWRPTTDSEWLLTCCVITTEPNALMAPIHDRMPVIIERAQWAAWLARGTSERNEVEPLMTQLDAGEMQAWPVSRAVSRGTAEGAELIEPISPLSPD